MAEDFLPIARDALSDVRGKVNNDDVPQKLKVAEIWALLAIAQRLEMIRTQGVNPKFQP